LRFGIPLRKTRTPYQATKNANPCATSTRSWAAPRTAASRFPANQPERIKVDQWIVERITESIQSANQTYRV